MARRHVGVLVLRARAMPIMFVIAGGVGIVGALGGPWAFFVATTLVNVAAASIAAC